MSIVTSFRVDFLPLLAHVPRIGQKMIRAPKIKQW
jgi:hypothetical protein